MYRYYCGSWTWNCTETYLGILPPVEFEESCAEGGHKCASWLPSCFVGKAVNKQDM